MTVSIAQNMELDKDLNNYGFLDIKTDSMNVPFFVDGYYVGNHPLDSPIPVLAGFHEVSYIPPDIQDEKVRDNLSDGIKRVYVAQNDTLEVFFSTTIITFPKLKLFSRNLGLKISWAFHSLEF